MAATHTSTQRIPLTAVAIPARYVVSTHPAGCGEETTYVYVRTTDRYRIYKVIHAIAHPATQGMPLAAIPTRYIVGSDHTCCGEVSAYVNVTATNSYSKHPIIHTITRAVT